MSNKVRNQSLTIHQHTADRLAMDRCEQKPARLLFCLRAFFAGKWKGSHCKHESIVRETFTGKRPGPVPFTKYQYETYMLALIKRGLVRRDERGFIYMANADRFLGRRQSCKSTATFLTEIPTQALLSNGAWKEYLAGVSISAAGETTINLVPHQERIKYIVAPPVGDETRSQPKISDEKEPLGDTPLPMTFRTPGPYAELPATNAVIELGSTTPDNPSPVSGKEVAMSLAYLMARLGCSKSTASRLRKMAATGGWIDLREQLAKVHLSGSSEQLRISKNHDTYFKKEVSDVFGSNILDRLRVRHGYVYQQLPSIVSFGKISFFAA